jgi:hypothetical protein
MRRVAFALIAAAALTIFAAPFARHEIFTLRDHTDYFQPLRFYTADVLRHGALPLWNPYNASGEPWLANPQTGVFYPPAWLFVAMPFGAAYMLYLFLHVLLLGCGAYLFFEDDGPYAALAGALALMLSGPVLSLLDISNNLATFAWIPLALWCAKRRRDVAGAFALTFAFLAGEPFFAAIAAVMYAAIVIRDRRPRALAKTAVLAFALSAVQLLPFLAMLRGSDRRAGLPRAQLFRESMPLRDWMRIVVPPRLHSAYDPHLGQHFIPIIYVGAFVAALALLGVVLRTRRVAGWLVLALLAMLAGAGEQVPFVAEIFARLPLTLFRYPARLVPLAAFAIAAIAVQGFAALLTHMTSARVTGLAMAILIVIDLRIATQPLFLSGPFRDVVPYDRMIGRATKVARIGEANGVPVSRGAYIAGYLNLLDHRFDTGTAAPLASQRYLDVLDAATNGGRGDLLDSIAAGFVLATRTLPPPHFEPVARAKNIIVHRNLGASPMAKMRGTNRWSYAVTFLSFTPSTAVVELRAPIAGTLVLTQQDAPGWSVEVDGKPARGKLVDGVFRGVDVAPGRHVILWTYRAPMLAAGAVITLLALLFLLVRCFIATRLSSARSDEKNVAVSLQKSGNFAERQV